MNAVWQSHHLLFYEGSEALKAAPWSNYLLLLRQQSKVKFNRPRHPSILRRMPCRTAPVSDSSHKNSRIHTVIDRVFPSGIFCQRMSHLPHINKQTFPKCVYLFLRRAPSVSSCSNVVYGFQSISSPMHSIQHSHVLIVLCSC